MTSHGSRAKCYKKLVNYSLFLMAQPCMNIDKTGEPQQLKVEVPQNAGVKPHVEIYVAFVMIRH